jgi:peptidoglycan/xylan/chitin deacetylase (PgdA/CDA1 family)
MNAEQCKYKKYIDTKMFSYPYGMYNYNLFSILKLCDFEIAFGTRNTRDKMFNNKFTIPRFTIKNSYEIKDFINLVK